MLNNTTLTATVITFWVAACSVVLVRYQKAKKEKHESKRAVPRAAAGFLETVTRLGGTDAPFFLLKLAQSVRGTSSCFRLPIPLGTGGLHVVGDPAVARQILMDAATSKPRHVYKAFQTGETVKTLFTSTSDGYAKSVRKSVAHAFSKREIDRMNAIAVRHVDEWINTRLKNFAETGEPFDPSNEMIRLTFFIINEAAFEYKTSDEEFQMFKYHSDVALREFAYKQITAPWRKVSLLQ